jgi:outer membrane protein assembly factor BamE
MATLTAMLAAGALLSGCAGLRSDTELLEALTPYKIEIVQGNVVTREQAALIKPGLTRDQVREILGAPMLTDVFHADRWDYPFTIHRGGKDLERRVVTVFFSGDAVKEIKAPELPTEREFVAARSNFKPSGKPVAPLELSEAQRRALPAPVRSAADARPEPQGAARSYPPLESR